MPKLGGGEIPPPTVTQDKKQAAQQNAAKLIAALSTDKPANDMPVLTPTQAEHIAKWGAKHVAFYLITPQGKIRYDYPSKSEFNRVAIKAGIIAQNNDRVKSDSHSAEDALRKMLKAGQIELITNSLPAKKPAKKQSATSVK